MTFLSLPPSFHVFLFLSRRTVRAAPVSFATAPRSSKWTYLVPYWTETAWWWDVIWEPKKSQWPKVHRKNGSPKGSESGNLHNFKERVSERLKFLGYYPRGMVYLPEQSQGWYQILYVYTIIDNIFMYTVYITVHIIWWKWLYHVISIPSNGQIFKNRCLWCLFGACLFGGLFNHGWHLFPVFLRGVDNFLLQVLFSLSPDSLSRSLLKFFGAFFHHCSEGFVNCPFHLSPVSQYFFQIPGTFFTLVSQFLQFSRASAEKDLHFTSFQAPQTLRCNWLDHFAFRL